MFQFKKRKLKRNSKPIPTKCVKHFENVMGGYILGLPSHSFAMMNCKVTQMISSKYTSCCHNDHWTSVDKQTLHTLTPFLKIQIRYILNKRELRDILNILHHLKSIQDFNVGMVVFNKWHDSHVYTFMVYLYSSSFCPCHVIRPKIDLIINLKRPIVFLPHVLCNMFGLCLLLLFEFSCGFQVTFL